MDIKISPSILASDYANLESELSRISNSDMIHIDVMDGHFVPNISIGAPVVAAIKKVCNIPFDVHLMISKPLDYAEDFANSGADLICFHAESDNDTEETIDKIISLGKKVGVALKPKTDINAVLPYLEKIDMVLVMTVEPGFGGQSFMEETMPKIKKLRSLGYSGDIEVDGGINEATAKIAAQAGANVFVAGSAVFKSESPNETINKLKRSVV